MSNPSFTQSQKRFSESLGANFSLAHQNSQKVLLFLKSSSDEGVIRNGGRNGARYAPQSFLSVFKKLSQDEGKRDYLFIEEEVSSTEEEQKDFKSAQLLESQRILSLLDKRTLSSICHLGGGHDHIYPLAMALNQKFKKIIIINIDAHADTRTDQEPHSGTPFRQLEADLEGEFHLFQIGLHPFANSSSTLIPLQKSSMKILWKKQLGDKEKISALFAEMEALIDKNTMVIFSLDADALDGSLVPGVSAVNGDGLSREQLQEFWMRYKKLTLSHPTVLGIYELNPVFDTLSALSMRTLATFLFESLE